MSNIFNGYYLSFYLDSETKNKIEKEFQLNELKLFKEKDIEQYKSKTECVDNHKYILPIGLFSNDEFLPNWKWINTTRNFDKFISREKESKINLYDNQKIIIKKVFEVLNKLINKKVPPYISLIAPCSTGKTIISLFLINYLKLKTVIILPNLQLVEQWVNQTEKFLPQMNVVGSMLGIKQLLKNNPNWDEIDILCIPYQHLINSDMHKIIQNFFPLGIIDEQHKYNTDTNNILSHFLSFTTFKMLFSLTASPRNINRLYFGYTLDVSKYKTVPTFKKIAYLLDISKEKYKPFPPPDSYLKYLKFKNNGKNMSKYYLLANLKNLAIADDKNRIKYICFNILKSWQNNNISRILLLTKFNKEIEYYKKELNSLNNKLTIYDIYSKKKNQTHDYNKEKFIIIATTDNIGTGFDLQSLNILHLSFLTKNLISIIQNSGRIERNNESSLHQIYFYNINSYSNLNILSTVNSIKHTLNQTEWDIKSEII